MSKHFINENVKAKTDLQPVVDSAKAANLFSRVLQACRAEAERKKQEQECNKSAA